MHPYENSISKQPPEQSPPVNKDRLFTSQGRSLFASLTVNALFSACHRIMQTLIIAISTNSSTGKEALYFACVTVASGTCLLLYFSRSFF